MNKKILASLIIIGILGFALGWGTYSYFSDTETSTGNRFQAGTMDLKIGTDGGTSISVSGLAPGDSGSGSIVVSNVGSLHGALNLKVADVRNYEGENPESETDKSEPGELGQYLEVTIYFDDDGDLDTWWDQTFVCSGVINDLKGQSFEAWHPLLSGSSSYLVIVYKVLETAGNDAQGDIVEFDLDVTLDQATIIVSSEMSPSPTGWYGWSDKVASSKGWVRNGIVHGGDIARKIRWVPGASVDTVDYPATPFGYTYDESIPETGYIVQNDNDSGETQLLILVYPP